MNLKNCAPVLLSLVSVLEVSGQSVETINNINSQLTRGETNISKVLSDTAYLKLHSLTPFREVIKLHAKAEKIKLTTDLEPGVRITIKGLVSDKQGRPLANKLVYVYQTSSEGWYSDTAAHVQMNEGDRGHARLFGYFKTDANAKFEFNTIKPKGYPKSDLPAHIHIEIAVSDGHAFISELLFDDDPRLVGDIRTRSMNEKFFIVKNSGSKNQPVYSYVIQMVQ